jgi:hypothetical protein
MDASSLHTAFPGPNPPTRVVSIPSVSTVDSPFGIKLKRHLPSKTIMEK